jgi:hypothetical protein
MGMMLERAIAAMAANPEHKLWTLTELRLAAGIAIRSQYKLGNQLRADPRVVDRGSNAFSLIEAVYRPAVGGWVR